jgi:arylsulfatase A-like enzyme
MNAYALDWIDARDPSRPFFLFINYMDPHDSYDPPKEFRDKLAAKVKPELGFVRYRGDKRKTISSNEFVRDVAPRLSQQDWRQMLDLYDAELAYLDAQIGELLAALKERGLLDNTIVVITSDHGELFGEHGLANHFKTLSDEETHIPLFLRYPPGVPAGRRVQAPVQLRDILPTVLELAGIESAAPMDGQSLVALTGSSTGEATGARHETVGYLHRPVDKEYPFTASGHLLGLRTPQEKYVWSSTGKHEYYDLSADPAGQKNLHGQAAGEAQMAERLAQWRKQAGFENFGEKQKGVDRLMKDKLKALGYAQ